MDDIDEAVVTMVCTTWPRLMRRSYHDCKDSYSCLHMDDVDEADVP